MIQSREFLKQIVSRLHAHNNCRNYVLLCVFDVQDLLDLQAFQDLREIPEVQDLLEVPDARVTQDGLVNQEDQVHEDPKVSQVRQTSLLAYYVHIGYMKF